MNIKDIIIRGTTIFNVVSITHSILINLNNIKMVIVDGIQIDGDIYFTIFKLE